MLNKIKQHIYLFACLMTMIIFIVFLILNGGKLQRYMKGQENTNLNSKAVIRQVYFEIAKQFRDSILGDSQESQFQNRQLSLKVAKSNIKKQESQDKIKSLKSIDIYATNKWRIKIPKIRVNAPIVEGTTQECLRRTVGHFEQTNKWNGNVALAGHNRGYRCNFFQEIKKLQKGDLIIYSTQKGERRYRVVKNVVIKETNWSYIKNTKDNRITLITCEKNRKAYRRCVQAVEIHHT